MQSILAFLGKWFAQPDKVLHVAAGIGAQFVLGLFVPVVPTLCVVAFIAWGKERYDKAHADVHTPDDWDAFATVVGGLAVALVQSILG